MLGRNGRFGDIIMANGSRYMSRNQSIGDAAVDGLLAGMAAGLVMGVILVLLGLLDGTGPATVLGRFDPADSGSPAVGGLLHLAVSGIYGVILAILYRFLTHRWTGMKKMGWVIGVGYGLVLWLSAQFVFLPGLNSSLSEIVPLYFALSHLGYGAVLGYLLCRHQGY
jgi:hypothetical protein